MAQFAHGHAAEGGGRGAHTMYHQFFMPQPHPSTLPALQQSAGDGSEGVLTSSDDDSSESGLEDELAELAEKRVAQSRAGAGEGDDMPAAKDAEDKDKGEHAETEQSQQPALEQDAEEMRLRGGGQAKPQSMEDEAAGAGAAAMEVGDDEAGKADAPKTGQKKVEDSSSGGEKRSRRPVINLHAPDNEAIIKVPRELRSKLAPHQINGIRVGVAVSIPCASSACSVCSDCWLSDC